MVFNTRNFHFSEYNSFVERNHSSLFESIKTNICRFKKYYSSGEYITNDKIFNNFKFCIDKLNEPEEAKLRKSWILSACHMLRDAKLTREQSIVLFNYSKELSDNDLPVADQEKSFDLLTHYRAIYVPGDGSCLFHSIAHQVYARQVALLGTVTVAHYVRDEIADQLVKNMEKYKEKNLILGDFDAYVSDIRKTRFWGGVPECYAASDLYGVPVHVFTQYDKHFGEVLDVDGRALPSERYGSLINEPPIRLYYHKSHWMPIGLRDIE